MFKFLSNLTTNQRLALLAFILGAVAIAATPTRGGRVSIDGREMALLMQKGVDRVDVRTLAGWIIESRADVRLIDLREPAAFAAGPRIPSAENVPVAALAGRGTRPRRTSPPGERRRGAGGAGVVPAAGAKATRVPRSCAAGCGRGRKRSCTRAWTAWPAPERARVEAVSAHFGGAPRTGSTGGALAPAAAPAVAQVTPPPLPAAGAKKPAPAKKREGC